MAINDDDLRDCAVAVERLAQLRRAIAETRAKLIQQREAESALEAQVVARKTALERGEAYQPPADEPQPKPLGIFSNRPPIAQRHRPQQPTPQPQE